MIFFYVVALSMFSPSATEDVTMRLTAVVGGSVTLPDPVLQFGFLSHGIKTVALVMNEGVLEILEDAYEENLRWNQTTGLFTITDLQKNHSGVYILESKQGRIFLSSFNLSVYDSVAPPAVETLNVSSDRCLLLCSVDKQATLSWFRDDQLINQSSSAFSLTVAVHQLDSSATYRCVSANPKEEKSAYVNVSQSCRADGGVSIASETYLWAIPIPIKLIVLIILKAVQAAH